MPPPPLSPSLHLSCRSDRAIFFIITKIITDIGPCDQGYIGSPSFLHAVLGVYRTLKEANPDMLFICDPVSFEVPMALSTRIPPWTGFIESVFFF